MRSGGAGRAGKTSARTMAIAGALLGCVGLTAFHIFARSPVPPQPAPRNMRRPIYGALDRTQPLWEEPTTDAPTANLKTLLQDEAKARSIVRDLKSHGVVMETDRNAQEAIGKLQGATRKLIMRKYGDHARVRPGGTVFEVEMTVRFPEAMPNVVDRGSTGTIRIQTAPISEMPHAVWLFLEMVADWKGGKFHRNAGHVLQAMVVGGHQGLSFQEYSHKFPHVKHTLGYAGRPGGPAFYISTIDNTRNHGPASQGSKTEADSCFAKVIEGFNVVARMHTSWGHKQHGFAVDESSGFLAKSEEFINIDLKML